MKFRFALLSLVLLAFWPALPAGAEDAPPPVKGLFLLTDYPAVTVRPGTSSTINLRLRNYAMPPERFAMSIAGVPSGWTATLLGGGQPVAAAMVSTNDSTALQLRLDVPENAAMGTTQNLTVTAKGEATQIALPIAVSLAKDLPAKLSVKAQLPSLRGTAKSSFEYQLDVKNDSGRNLVVSLVGAGAAEFRNELHRAVRQPGALLDPDRGGPVQDRQVQGPAAGHDQRQAAIRSPSRSRPRMPRPTPSWRWKSPASRS